MSNLCFRNFQIEKVSKKHQKLRGTPSFAEHAAAYKDEIIAQENIRKKVDLINKAYDPKKKLEVNPLKKIKSNSSGSKARYAKDVSIIFGGKQ